MRKTVKKRGGYGRTIKSRKSPGEKVNFQMRFRIERYGHDNDDVDIRSFSSSAKTKFRNQVIEMVTDPDLNESIRIQNISFNREGMNLVVRGKLNTTKYSKDELEDYIHALNEKSIWQQPEVDSHRKQYKFTEVMLDFVQN